VIAAVMCGGLASRMKEPVEKPMLEVGGRPMIARVIDSLRNSRRFKRIVAAVSPNTPATRDFLESSGVEIVETPGRGYSSDLSVLLGSFRPERVFVISADMPLVDGRIIAEIAAKTQSSPVLSVVLAKRFVEIVGFTPSANIIMNGVEYCQSGISLFDTSRRAQGIMKEEYLVMDKVEVAVNVNTKEELVLAEKLLIQRA
jgi:adenosylcobinamide-phosphate guanylyltransferase